MPNKCLFQRRWITSSTPPGAWLISQRYSASHWFLWLDLWIVINGVSWINLGLLSSVYFPFLPLLLLDSWAHWKVDKNASWHPQSKSSCSHKLLLSAIGRRFWMILLNKCFNTWLILRRPCMRAKLLSYVWLCDPVDCSLSGFSVHGIFQARILEWVAMPLSRGPSQPRAQTHVCWVSCIGSWILCHWHQLRSPRRPHIYLFVIPTHQSKSDCSDKPLATNFCELL